MNDTHLKICVLRGLVKDIENEKCTSWSMIQISNLVYKIENYRLLSDPMHESMGKKQIENWLCAVDDWVKLLLTLAETNAMPDKCWIGICLLGVTCQECSSDLFLKSYAVWYDKLILHLQNPVDSLKTASCTALACLITRLGGFPNAKVNGISLTGKLINFIIKLVERDTSENVLEGMINLLYAAITSYPTLLGRHFDIVEAAVTSKLFCEHCSFNALQGISRCLAMLPIMRGDENTWMAMMRKLLLVTNGFLSDIFDGLEEENKWYEAVRLLVPSSETVPDSIWNQKLTDVTLEKPVKMFRTSRVSALMLSCCIMLTSVYPSKVTVPFHSLICLVERVLSVEKSRVHMKLPGLFIMGQEFFADGLVILNSCSLQILSAIINCVRSQLLPHVARIQRIIKDYFKTCTLPDVRIKIYSVAKDMLTCSGAGAAIYLAPDIVENFLVDMDKNHAKCAPRTVSPLISRPQPKNRKRKRAQKRRPDQEASYIDEDEPSSYPEIIISLKIAAAETLEALFTMGGALRSESWRPKVEDALVRIALDLEAIQQVSASRKFGFISGYTHKDTDFQLSIYRALLASTLVPSRSRPLHLTKILQLFHRGRQQTDKRVTEFCAHALLSLEVLIHPRGLPLISSEHVNANGELGHKDTRSVPSGDYINLAFHDYESSHSSAENGTTRAETAVPTSPTPVEKPMQEVADGGTECYRSPGHGTAERREEVGPEAGVEIGASGAMEVSENLAQTEVGALPWTATANDVAGHEELMDRVATSDAQKESILKMESEMGPQEEPMPEIVFAEPDSDYE